jgi:2-isopropylmalate synthase
VFEATGDGPIDALYGAIDGAVGEHHDLLSYDIRSITHGADALGEVSVSIGSGRKTYQGSATNTDVILASANAYLEALNKLVVYRTDVEAVEFVSNGIMQSFTGEKVGG